MTELSQLNERATCTIADPPCIEQGLGLRRTLLMDRTVDLLIEKAKAAECWPELYERALQVLHTLPLPTHELSLASQRIQNAFTYASMYEFGSAAFELRLLRGQLAA